MEVVPSGSATIDTRLLLDFDGSPLGGLPAGRVIHLYGPPCSGVTTFCLSVFAQCRSGLWVDADLSFPGGRAFGPEHMLLRPGDSGAAWDIYRSLAPVVECVVIDSWDGMLANVEGAALSLGWLCQAAGDATLLVASHLWHNLEEGRDFTYNEKEWRQLAAVGLHFEKPHEVAVGYSSICQQGRRVHFDDLPERIRAGLQEGA